MPDGYNSKRVKDLTGVTQRNLDYWVERGVIVPSIAVGRGKGTERLYSFEDIVKVRVVKHLRETGLSLDKIQRALKKLKARDPNKDPLLEEYLISDGKRVLHHLEGGHLEDVLADGQFVLNIVRIGLIREETRKATLRLERKQTRLNGGASRRRATS